MNRELQELAERAKSDIAQATFWIEEHDYRRTVEHLDMARNDLADLLIIKQNEKIQTK
jgi:histone H3/H4